MTFDLLGEISQQKELLISKKNKGFKRKKRLAKRFCRRGYRFEMM